MRRLTLILLVLSVILGSCQLQKVMVDVYTPARLVFPPDTRSVLVTSRYVPATGPYEDVQWGAYETVDSLKWSLAESIVDTLAKRMADSKKFLVKARHFPRMLRHNEAGFPDPVPWEGLANYAKKEYVQAVWILEGFDIGATPVNITETNGNSDALRSVAVSMAIRIYEPDKMRMIDDSVYSFVTEFRGTGKSREEAVSQLPDDRQAMFTACSAAADAYFELINPGEMKVERNYFTDRDSSMQVAEQAVREGKWGRAESKWKWLAYNAPDSSVQAKASYNMAMICERDGRLNQALGFARRSQRIMPDKNTLTYIGILEKRMSDLENQVNQKKIIKRW
jgi:hypothetical protein